MNILSLFDGIAAGRLALERAGISVEKYYASEIDPYAIKIANKNFPDIIQLGDVTKVRGSDLPGIDLLIGGSPCQGFSLAGKQLNFEDPRSKLFFEFVRLMKECQPKYFMLENVKMKKEWEDRITDLMGVEPVEIDSALVSAQHRKRLYWTNIPIDNFPEDRNIFLKDIVLHDVYPVVLHNLYGGFNEKSVRVFEEKSPTLRTAAGGGHIPSLVYKCNRNDGLIEPMDKSVPLCASDWRGLNRNQNQNAVVDIQKLIHSEKALEYMDRQVKDGRTHWDFKHYSDIAENKSATVVANFFKGVPYNVFKDWNCVRKFHPIECERLQTFPDNYTEGISDTQRYKCLGNSWTVDVIAHIFKGIMKDNI